MRVDDTNLQLSVVLLLYPHRAVSSLSMAERFDLMRFDDTNPKSFVVILLYPNRYLLYETVSFDDPNQQLVWDDINQELTGTVPHLSYLIDETMSIDDLGHV